MRWDIVVDLASWKLLESLAILVLDVWLLQGLLSERVLSLVRLVLIRWKAHRVWVFFLAGCQ